MQECGQPPSELVGEMVRLHFFAVFFELGLTFSLVASGKNSNPFYVS